MSLSLRIFLVYSSFVAVVGYFVLNSVVGEIKPAVRQATEETLVDTANLLAEFLREPLLSGEIQNVNLDEVLRAYGKRNIQATIWGVNKTQLNHRIYVTDQHGIVLLDSLGQAVGQDYSHWNDVFLTLQGKYGARSTAEIPGDEYSSVMYVAAPILNNGKIIGVVSVAKPNRSIQPYINRTLWNLYKIGGIAILLGLLVGIFLSLQLTKDLRALRRYAQSVARGENPVMPQGALGSGELKELAGALGSMRFELDGKAYIERYIQTLTHELKSPLAGIHAATELLQSPMLEEDRTRFLANIKSDARRMQSLIEKLLDLARLEQQQIIESSSSINLGNLADEIVQEHQSTILASGVKIARDITGEVIVQGDRFLLKQAFNNLFDNALDFAQGEKIVRIKVAKEGDSCSLVVVNSSEVIPSEILARATERFFSMPRPASGKKSTGLGLNFVQEVVHLHNASLTLANTPEGVLAKIRFSA